MAKIHDRLVEILRKHPDGIKIDEIRGQLGVGAREQQHLDRRIRELGERYELSYDPRRGYRLGQEREAPLEQIRVTKTQRARILLRDLSRCQMCGRTAGPAKLDIDHRIPRDWGGPTEDWNLWALCEECNEGKRNYFRSLPADFMSEIMAERRVHHRLAKALSMSGSAGIRAELVQIVAQQREWDRRLRELRDLGWNYRTVVKSDARGQRQTTYYVTAQAPLPDDPRSVIRAAELKRRKAR